jgi:glutaredoxin
MSVLLVLVALSATPLETAQSHLKAGKLDDVLFALDGQAFTGDDKPKAAALLGDAAKAAVAKKDELLALQFAQMALKLDPKQPAALEAAARTSQAQQQFEAAERSCDTWIEVDGANAQARLLRAQLAVDNADWQVALDQLAAAKFSGTDSKKAQLIKTKATKELSDKKSSQSAIAALEKQIADASKARDNEPATVTRVADANTNDVILYMTSWCGYCRKAGAFLNARKVFFTEKNIEEDPEASKELAQKAARAGVKPQGVPVIDVRGKLVLGFDQNALDRALQ